MTIEFFAGGPLAGWREVPEVSEVVFQVGPGTDLASGRPRPTKGYYVRRRFLGGGWQVAIPIWIQAHRADRSLSGLEIPGLVVGAPFPQQLTLRGLIVAGVPADRIQQMTDGSWAYALPCPNEGGAGGQDDGDRGGRGDAATDSAA